MRSVVDRSAAGLESHRLESMTERVASSSPGGIRTPDQGIMSPLEIPGKIEVSDERAAQASVRSKLKDERGQRLLDFLARTAPEQQQLLLDFLEWQLVRSG